MYQTLFTSSKVDNISLAPKDRSGGGQTSRRNGQLADKRVMDERLTKEAECWYSLQKGHFEVDCPTRKEVIRRCKERKSGNERNEAAKVAEKLGDVSSDEEKAFMLKCYHYANLHD